MDNETYSAKMDVLCEKLLGMANSYMKNPCRAVLVEEGASSNTGAGARARIKRETPPPSDPQPTKKPQKLGCFFSIANKCSTPPPRFPHSPSKSLPSVLPSLDNVPSPPIPLPPSSVPPAPLWGSSPLSPQGETPRSPENREIGENEPNIEVSILSTTSKYRLLLTKLQIDLVRNHPHLKKLYESPSRLNDSIITLERCVRLDGIPFHELEAALVWGITTDPFWIMNIQSFTNLRSHWKNGLSKVRNLVKDYKVALDIKTPQNAKEPGFQARQGAMGGTPEAPGTPEEMKHLQTLFSKLPFLKNEFGHTKEDFVPVVRQVSKFQPIIATILPPGNGFRASCRAVGNDSYCQAEHFLIWVYVDWITKSLDCEKKFLQSVKVFQVGGFVFRRFMLEYALRHIKDPRERIKYYHLILKQGGVSDPNNLS